MNKYLDIAPEVAEALAAGKPVVALESTIISHGMPYPQNVETALKVEQIIRDAGAVPATIAIIGGRLKAGLSKEEIDYLGKTGAGIPKASRRDLPILVAQGRDGACTVTTTMMIADMAGIRVFATGGIGGVHRGAQETFDISADLEELANTSVMVICAGAKSILDLGLTLEYLETHGVTVIGYGPVGQGFARRIRALGAEVTICDIDPVASLKAVFDGFAAQDIDEALPCADMVVSATGVRHTVTLEHMRAMHEGAALAVIGGIANEIALDEVSDFTPQVNRDTVQLNVPNGPTLTLIADGDGVNYTVGGGNPIEIMDLSFAVQASAVAYLLEHRGTLDHTLIRLDAATDQRIAASALKARGYRASHAVEDNGYNWRLTRFAENDRENADR